MKRRRPDNSVLEGTPQEMALFEMELMRLHQNGRGVQGSSWTPMAVQKFFLLTSPKVEALVCCALDLGSGCSSRELAKHAGTKTNALGPMFGKAVRDAADADETLPVPFMLRGSAGDTQLWIDDGFARAYQQLKESK